MELTLQSQNFILLKVVYMCRNPYFIGINSAICVKNSEGTMNQCRNPYFIGINSAILGGLQHGNDLLKVAILILLELTLQ